MILQTLLTWLAYPLLVSAIITLAGGILGAIFIDKKELLGKIPIGWFYNPRLHDFAMDMCQKGFWTFLACAGLIVVLIVIYVFVKVF